ncbi:phage/plasmid primase%2C P4 family%2C C-terminal domain [Chlamydia trachomatis]|nr:phage/plasmid primase%2C P4 family%2C C-terminal domain [Chlamydia trachomatis]
MNEAINPNHTRGKLAIMLGDGNNGKGTFQSLLINLIGVDKVATLRPDQFEGHNLASLAGKVCNIGDDISNKYIDEVSDLMSVVTGDMITINPKHQQPFELSLKLFCLFSANELPRGRNKSKGWYRRLCIIPFNADFNGQKERPEIKNEFLKDKELLEWVLFRILNLPAFDKFIEPKAVQKELAQYKLDNDPILTWVTEFYIPNNWHKMKHVPLFIARNHLREFLEDMGYNKPNLGNFGKKTIKHLEEQTTNKYELKGAKTDPIDFGTLDPLGFQRDRIKNTTHGISKKNGEK